MLTREVRDALPYRSSYIFCNKRNVCIQNIIILKKFSPHPVMRAICTGICLILLKLRLFLDNLEIKGMLTEVFACDGDGDIT